MSLTQTVHDELTGDPLGRGYPALVTAQDWPGLAAMLNSGTGATLRAPTITRADLQVAMLPAIIALRDPAKAALLPWWMLVLNLANARETIDLANPAVATLFGSAVSDGLLTADQAGVIGRVPCSRLQELAGSLSVLATADLVRDALGG